MARSPRTRITLAEGIYQDAHGISVIARLGSKPNLLEAKARFPLVDDDGIPYSKRNNSELIKCRLLLLEDLKEQRERAGGETGTLGAAIDAWLLAHPVPDKSAGQARKKRQNENACLAHWRVAPVARVGVAALKRSAVRAQLEAWITEGRAPSTVNQRKDALTHVLRWTLGADDDTDVVIITEGIEHRASSAAEVRGMPMPILARILATMPDRGRPVKGEPRPTLNETKIRLRVMTWTGLSHISLERLERARVKFREGKMFYPDREKGAGAAGLWVDLLPAALEALRDFDRAGLWGKSFSRSSMYRSYNRAVRNTRQALIAAVEKAEAAGDAAAHRDAKVMLEQFLEAVPANPYPYDTRHSFLSEVYRIDGDLRTVQVIGQHADLETSKRYTKGVVPERVASAVDKMRAKWFPEAPKPGATVRDFHVVTTKGLTQ